MVLSLELLFYDAHSIIESEYYILFCNLYSNSIVSVAGDKTETISPMLDQTDVNECKPLFSGVKYCIGLQYSDAINDAFPYVPLSGDSK